MNNVDWSYFDKFKDVIEKYLPDIGEGETLATQTVTAINKLIYKWYNDGDVFDNTYYLQGWANDLSSYANWLNKYVTGASTILDKIFEITTETEYELILKDLADKYLNKDFLITMEEPKQESIYECEGPYRFDDYMEDEEEKEYEW